MSKRVTYGVLFITFIFIYESPLVCVSPSLVCESAPLKLIHKLSNLQTLIVQWFCGVYPLEY